MIAQPILVGHHGVKVDVKNALHNLSPGKKVNPASLFEAQLKLRLGDAQYRQVSSGK